jgi:hypothetical protein
VDAAFLGSLKREEVRFAAIVCVTLVLALVGCAESPSSSSAAASDLQPEQQTVSPKQEDATSASESTHASTGILQSPEDIELQPTDDYGANYMFFYGDEVFNVYYEPDCWRVYDSYKITNKSDLVIICQALINEHEIHGRDLESFRTAEDMAYEWQQHNLAYTLAPNDSSWKQSAQNVDLDPDEQNMTLEEIYLTRDDSSL